MLAECSLLFWEKKKNKRARKFSLDLQGTLAHFQIGDSNVHGLTSEFLLIIINIALTIYK